MQKCSDGEVERKWGREKRTDQRQPVLQTGDSVETHQAFCSDTCHMLRLEVWRTFRRLMGDRAGKPVGAKGWTTFVPGASFCGHRAPRVLLKVAL